MLLSKKSMMPLTLLTTETKKLTVKTRPLRLNLPSFKHKRRSWKKKFNNSRTSWPKPAKDLKTLKSLCTKRSATLRTNLGKPRLLWLMRRITVGAAGRRLKNSRLIKCFIENPSLSNILRNLRDRLITQMLIDVICRMNMKGPIRLG